MRIAIVGGGITGLAAAFLIERRSPRCEIVLYEADARLGGTALTETVDGFRFEAGGNGFLTNKREMLDLVAEAGAEALLLPSAGAARRRFVYTDRLHPLPETPLALLRSRLLGPLGKLRLAAEVLVPRRLAGGEETVQAFGYRRVGRAFTDVFLDAMVAGIHASTPDRLSVDAAFPAVVRLEQEHGGLFRGMLALKQRSAGPSGVLTSFKGGVGAFITHLAARIRGALVTATPVRSLARSSRGWCVNTDFGAAVYDGVVIACPAYTAAAILYSADPDLASALAEIDYTPVAVVGLGYRQIVHPMDGFGLLTTRASGLDILGVLWDSSIFPDRAPPRCQMLRVMIGGQRRPDLVTADDRDLLETARIGVRRTMGVERTPDVTFLKRWHRGIPHYRPGHLALLTRIEALRARTEGLVLAGNAYHGVGMNDCVASARAAAERVLALEE